MFRVIIFSLVLIVMHKHQGFSVEGCGPRCLPDGKACDIFNPQRCCSVICPAGICGTKACIPNFSICDRSEDCCSGICELPADGSTAACAPLCLADGSACDINNPQRCCNLSCPAGICGPVLCLPAFSRCVLDEDCCSGLCDGVGTPNGSCI